MPILLLHPHVCYGPWPIQASTGADGADAGDLVADGKLFYKTFDSVLMYRYIFVSYFPMSVELIRLRQRNVLSPCTAYDCRHKHAALRDKTLGWSFGAACAGDGF